MSQSGRLCFSKILRHTALVAAVYCSATVYAAEPRDSVQASRDATAQPAGRSPDYPTVVLFGDVHLHTGLSADAGGSGTRLMPADAYRFALGEQVTSNSGQQVQMRSPYDFLAVTDHTDGMGAIKDILEGAPNIMADVYGRELNAAFNKGGKTARAATVDMIARFSQGKISDALNYQPGNPAYRDTWESIVRAAEEYNTPGRFTTLVGFEWTSLVKGNNLHRVVLMRDGAPRATEIDPPTTMPPVGSPNPRSLWRWMETWERTTGGQILAIPHNGNLSNGWMFPLVDNFNKDNPLDQTYLENRMRWEPLVEVTQMKGDGETHPLLSPDDAFANFETWDMGNLDVSAAKTAAMLPGEYARSALLRGLVLDQMDGINPYKFGMIGSTDSHTSLSTATEEMYFGKMAPKEPRPGRAFGLEKTNKELQIHRPSWRSSAGGLTAVWARENTREEIFDAMKRREVYATTGPRISVRFFGGFGFTDNDLLDQKPTAAGYSKGVPMGGNLAAAPSGESPAFIVAAMKDPEGGNLDRIQIVKGWLDANGKTHERVFDVVWSQSARRARDNSGRIPPVGNTVDPDTATWTNTIGSIELMTLWRDPEFNPSLRSFYYARVIEIPTPRWTTYDAVRFNQAIPEGAPISIQERAYTSPIWYTPPAPAN